MKKIYILLILFSVGIIDRADAQILNINYRLSTPLGDSHDFISQMSFRGGDLEYHHFISAHWTVGLSIGWNTYYKHLDYKTNDFILNSEKVSITGDQFRYLNVIPVLADIRYHLTKGDAAVLPYVGMGIGCNWAETRLEIGDLLAKEKGWQLALAPEAGLIIPFCEQVGLNLGRAIPI